jgi:hypothetical protein
VAAGLFQRLNGSGVDLPVLGPKDVDDVQNFAAKHGMDYVFASFVQSADDVRMIRKVRWPFGLDDPVDRFVNLEAWRRVHLSCQLGESQVYWGPKDIGDSDVQNFANMHGLRVCELCAECGRCADDPQGASGFSCRYFGWLLGR